LKKIEGDMQKNKILILLLAFYFMVLLSGCQSLPLINCARILPKDQHELLLGYLYEHGTLSDTFGECILEFRNSIDENFEFGIYLSTSPGTGFDLKRIILDSTTFAISEDSYFKINFSNLEIGELLLLTKEIGTSFEITSISGFDIIRGFSSNNYSSNEIVTSYFSPKYASYLVLGIILNFHLGKVGDNENFDMGLMLNYKKEITIWHDEIFMPALVFGFK